MSSKPRRSAVQTRPPINRRFPRPNYRTPRPVSLPRRIFPRKLDRPAFQRGGRSRPVDSFLRLGIFLGLLVFLSIATLIFEHVYADRISPHVSVGGIALGGVSLSSAPAYLQQKVDARDNLPIVLHLQLPSGDRIFEVKAKQFHSQYDLRTPLQAARADGHNGDTLTNLWNQLGTMVQGHDYAITGVHDQASVIRYLAWMDKQIDIPPIPAQVGIQNGQVAIVRHTVPGTIIDVAAAARLLSQAIDSHAVFSLSIPLLRVDPPVNDAVAQVTVDQARALLSRPTYFSSVNRIRAWYLQPSQLLHLIAFNPTYLPGKGWTIAMQINARLLSATMAPIAAAVNRPPIPASFTVAEVNGVASAVPQPDGPGTAIDIKRTAQAILNAAVTNHTVVLPLLYPRAKFDQAAARALNLDTEMGSGPTELANSSPARIHDAQVAATAVSNTLLKPGEVFSLIKTLGPVIRSAGYTPGLNRIGKADISGVNSGVTQVASALFQAAYAAGLPIRSRTPYPYLTAFDGPPGMDAMLIAGRKATDLQFQNDTSHTILVSVTVYGDRVVAYLFNNSQVQRTVHVAGPTVTLNQDGSVDTTISRVVRGDVSKQDSVASHYDAIDSYP